MIDSSRLRAFLRPALTGLFVAMLAAPAGAVTIQDTAPDFTLKSLEGSNLRLDEIAPGRAHQLLASRRPGPCRQEMPLLDRLHQRYVDTGFAVLGINVEGEEAPARALIDKIPVTFPVLIDEGQQVSELYKLEAMPSTIVLDRDGVVRYIHRGYKPGDEAKYVEVVRELIRE
ncbi:MAG: TlpA disulfide reductase family protein [Gammaproteobacteria bacterium]|nr:TlpA disulfide reductase family protein [Gammaproteobacteria bacterium]